MQHWHIDRTWNTHTFEGLFKDNAEDEAEKNSSRTGMQEIGYFDFYYFL